MRLPLLALCVLLGTLSCSLTACIHHLDSQQGNIISNKAVQQLKLGMTQAQVENLFGSPVLVQSFNDRISYIYSWRSDETPYHVKNLTLFFSNGRLVKYQKDFANN